MQISSSVSLKVSNIAYIYILYVDDTVLVTNSLELITLPCSVSRSSDEIESKVIESEKQEQMQIRIEKVSIVVLDNRV